MAKKKTKKQPIKVKEIIPCVCTDHIPNCGDGVHYGMPQLTVYKCNFSKRTHFSYSAFCPVCGRGSKNMNCRTSDEALNEWNRVQRNCYASAHREIQLFDWNSDDVEEEIAPTVSSGKEKILEALKKAHEEAEKLGAVLECDHTDFYDDSHLNCIWYGGCFATLKYRGFEVWLVVCGEVRFTYFADFEHEIEMLDYVDKNNDGAYRNSEALDVLKNDTCFKIADDEGRIEWGNNNWIEFRIYDENNENVTELFDMDTVLGDNVLEELDGLNFYTEFIDKYIEDRPHLDHSKLKITRIVEESTKIYFDYDGKHFLIKEREEDFEYSTELYERTLNEHGFHKVKNLFGVYGWNSIFNFIKKQKGKTIVYSQVDKKYFENALRKSFHNGKSFVDAILQSFSTEGEQNG